MKMTIERAALLKSLAHVQSVVERRNTIPILSNVLLDAADDMLALTATDMDITIAEKVAAQVGTKRRHAPCRRTRSTTSCASCPTARRSRLEGSADGGQVALKAGRSRFNLCYLAAGGFSRPWPAAICRTKFSICRRRICAT